VTAIGIVTGRYRYRHIRSPLHALCRIELFRTQEAVSPK
jgi:hypothetical protein